MSLLSIPPRARALFWFLVSLVVLLSAGTAATIAYQRHLIREEMTKHLEREIHLLGDVVQAALITRNYAEAQRNLNAFCRDHDEIAQARLVAPNGFVLARFERHADPDDVSHLSRTVTYGGGRHVDLEVSLDLSPIQVRLRRLAVTMGTASALFAALMGLLLWRILRATAFRPLEQAVEELTRTREHLELRVAERTADWMMSNKELKAEISERLEVEQQLIIKDRAIASSINGIALAKFDGKLTYVNESFLALWGYRRPEEVIGRHATEFWQSGEAAAEIMRSIVTGGTRMGELTALKGDGTAFEAQFAADIVRDSEGMPICLMASFVDVTERKRAEAALRKQKDFTAAVLNIVGAIMVVLDRDGKIIRFNRECERVSRYRAEEALGRRVWDFLIPSEQIDQVKEVFQRLSAGMFPNHYENYWVARDGTRRLISWSNTCLAGESGEVEFVIATGIDITASRDAELSLRSSEERLRSITEAIADVIYRLRPDGSVTYASPSVRAVLGYSPEEMEGIHFTHFVHPEDRERSKEAYRQLLDGRPVRDLSLRLLRSMGETIDAEINVIPIMSNGSVIELQGVIRDVTERKAAEQAARANEARTRLIMENIDEIIYQVSIADEADPYRASVEFVSGRVLDIVGYEAGEFLRDPHLWLSIIHRDDLPVIAASARRLIAERSGGTRIYRIRHGRTGDHIWIEDKVVPRRDGQGRINGYFGVARDITSAKLADDALKAAVVRAEEEKNKSAAIIAAIGDAISIQDREFKVLYQNDKHRSLIGGHGGEYCYEAYEKRSTVCDGCPVALSFADGKVHTVERKGRTDDGKTVYVEVTTSPLRDANGRIIAGIEVARDITARKRMEQDLRVALETQSVISDLLRIPSEDVSLAQVMEQALGRVLKSSLYSFHAIGGIFLVDEATNALTLVAQQGFGEYVREACQEVPVGTCLCGRAAASGQIEFAADVDERHEIRFPGIEPHGHYCIPVFLGGRTAGILVLYLEQGHVRQEREEEFLRSVASALAVVIHRKRMEGEREALIANLRRLLDAVSMSQQEWRETFDSITDPIMLVDAERRVRKANRAFAGLFGLRPQAVIDRDCLELLYREQTPPDGDPIIQGLREARPVEGEIADLTAKRTYRASVFPFTITEKELPGAIIVLKDITEDREREMRLIMTERLASLGQMASGIAHEINNPLAAIAGCVDGMSRRINRNQVDTELFLRYLKIIKDEITRSKSITTSMLSFVRKSSYEQKHIDLHATIDSTLEIIGYQGRLRTVEVRKRFLADPPVVLGSEGEVRQVLLILISNALDAMQDRGVLTIGTGAEEANVTIDIGDTGPGIPAELLQRIFDPFFTTKSEQGGTGLGLSIAQRIVAGHNGTLRVLSPDAGGTILRIAFPR